MQKRSTGSLVFVVLSLSILLAPCGAQQPGTDKPAAALEVQAREVILPVTVRDKHGELVTDLTASDFALTDNGKPQVIKSFSRESNLPFQVGLLVDTSRSMNRAMETERKAAEKFVDLMLPADPAAGTQGDQAFLIHFDHEVELLEDFTNSRSKLDNDLEQMGPTSAERNSSDNSQGPETNDSGGGYGGRQGGMRGGGTQLYDAIYLASNDMMKPKNGRKALVVFSDGEDRGSKESLNDAIDAAEHANTTIYTIYFKGEGGGGGFPGGRRHGGMGGGWPHGGMGGGWPGGGGGWPGGGGGYPGGGGRRGGGGAPQVDGKKIMAEIATRTGGRPFEAKKVDDLAGIYNQIAEELRGQYLLTYTPDPFNADGSFHKVALSAKKGDLTVVTREGYYAPEQ